MWEHTGDNESDATGDALVDEALRPLDRLPDMPVHEHVAVVEAVHERLRARLSGDEQANIVDEEG